MQYQGLTPDRCDRPGAGRRVPGHHPAARAGGDAGLL